MLEMSIVSDEKKIYEALCILSGELYNQSLNHLEILKSLSEKYSKNATVIIVSSDEKVKGLCAFYDNDVVTKEAYLSMIVVASDSQRQGVGKALLERVSLESRIHGMEKLALEVAKENTNAIRFYGRNGFVLEQEKENSYIYIKEL